MYKVFFWATVYLAQDRALFDAVRAEVAGRDKHSLDDCPLLDSLILETIRITSQTALARDVLQQTEVHGLTLHAGSKVMVSTPVICFYRWSGLTGQIPFRHLHFDPAVWGTDVTPDRFVKEPKLKSNASYRPFGGGQELCPGRVLTRRSIALALGRFVNAFDMTDVHGGVPRVWNTKPNPGISLPVGGDDVHVTLVRRA